MKEKGVKRERRKEKGERERGKEEERRKEKGERERGKERGGEGGTGERGEREWQPGFYCVCELKSGEFLLLPPRCQEVDELDFQATRLSGVRTYGQCLEVAEHSYRILINTYLLLRGNISLS